MTRRQLKALPTPQLTASMARAGDLTVLAFVRETRTTRNLYALLPDLKLHYRAVKDDPLKALIVERHLRSIWSRLVDRADGYWLLGRPGPCRFADA